MQVDQDFAAMAEKCRQCNEERLKERLAQDQERKSIAAERACHVARNFELEQVITSLRWWAVFALTWMLWAILEPARYAWGFPTSWAFKLAALSAQPWIVTAWFAIAAVLVLPLIFALVTAPNTRFCRKSEGLACCGLFMGGVGFAALSAAAARLDIPHVVDSYRGNTVMLLGTGLLVACWHNGRVVRARKEADHCSQGEIACADSGA